MEENNMTQNDGAQVNPSNIISRVIGIITKPKEEWEKVAKEKASVPGIMLGYLVPLALIPTIATIIGLGVVGRSYGFGLATMKFKSWTLGITSGISTFIISVAAFYITALIVDALATAFKSEKNMARSMQLVAYGSTPFWVAGIFNIFPSMYWLQIIVGLYGIYLMYLAYGPVKKTPEENKIGYVLSTVGILLVTYIILAVIIGLIVAMIYVPRLGSFGF